jgi:hypothetical protein
MDPILAGVWGWLKEEVASKAIRSIFGLTHSRKEIGLIVNLQPGGHQTIGKIVSQQGGQQAMVGRAFNALNFEFINRTGQVVYLSRARLHEHQKTFPVPPEAARDVSGWCELKFANRHTGLLDLNDIVLQTADRATTGIAVAQPINPALFTYQPERWRGLLRRPKYFRLQFTAMVGRKEHPVERVF